MSPSTAPATWTSAAHLVRSTGFGATGSLVDAVAAAGPATWLETSLRADPQSDPGVKATPAPTFQAVEAPGKGASQERRLELRKLAREQVTDLVRWWIRRMVAVENPMTEKLTFGWHHHFATSATKVRSAGMLLAQNEKLRSLGRGGFTALAEAMVKDPAMLYWLDGQKNSAKAPNENLAREFIELFALGHGSGYTEQDVREGARALTGWVIRPAEDGAPSTARFVRKRHDSGAKTLLGTKGTLDADDVVRVVLGQPASAPFVVSRWWRLLASPEAPPADTLTRAVAAYGPSRDLTAMLRALLTDPGYAAAAGSHVVSPVEWVVGAMRALAVPTDEKALRTVMGVMRSLGQLPFYPPNVSGWPSGQAWLSTASATTRVHAAAMLAAAGDLSPVEDAKAPSRVEVVTHLLGLPTVSARTAAELKRHVSDPRKLVVAALVSPENLVI